MKMKSLTIFVVMVLVFAGLAPRNVHAQAYTTSFSTSITYQNVGTAGTTLLQILFYATPSTTTPITISRPTLAAGASTSVSIASLSGITAPFQGSAVMQADQPLLATLVQLPMNSTTVYVRPLSNGFSAGAATAMIASVIKNASGVNTTFSIQNVDSVTNIVDIKFYDTSATLVTEIPSQSVEAGASYYVDAGSYAPLGASFNGSVVATATRGDASPGKIIGSAMERDITTNGAKAFESVSAGANTIYMPSALCDYGGNMRTAYAVQNTSLTTSTHVTVTYRPGGLTGTATIGGGAKASFRACDTLGAGSGFIGSAVITTNLGDPPIIALGKASGNGLSTAFLGQATGAAKLSLPYVRWAPDQYYHDKSHQRTSIAIQNVGANPIPSGDITITYTDSFGHTGTHTWNNIVDVGAKFSSNPTLATPSLIWFGSAEPPASGFGGGAIINCSAPNCQLMAIGRVSTYVTSSNVVAEDYNAMAVP